MSQYKPVEVATAIMLYLHNRRPEEIVRRLFPDAVNYYLVENCARVKEGFGPFFGHLDKDHRARFVQHALDAYGGEVRHEIPYG